MKEHTPILHKLPDDPGPGDGTWFENRQNEFERQEIRRQVAYKRSQWPDLPDCASHRGTRYHYPHILPTENERLAYFDGFADEAIKGLKADGIAIHSEALNLKSSQAACINFLYPLKNDRIFAAKVLAGILPSIATVTAIEFEYTGQDESKTAAGRPCTKWLGEPAAGKRGQNRTSIDAAIVWIDTRNETHITLVEWKYTERNFGTCSAFDKAPTAAKDRCRNLNILDDPAADCILAGDRRHCGRRYWQHMVAAGISLTKLARIRGCPFRGPFYQLMRQHLVAAYLRQNTIPEHTAQHIDIIALEFEGNHALRAIPASLKPLCTKPTDTVIDAWNSILDNVPPLRRVTAEQLLAGYDNAQQTDPAWRTYIRARYGI